MGPGQLMSQVGRSSMSLAPSCALAVGRSDRADPGAFGDEKQKWVTQATVRGSLRERLKSPPRRKYAPQGPVVMTRLLSANAGALGIGRACLADGTWGATMPPAIQLGNQLVQATYSQARLGSYHGCPLIAETRARGGKEVGTCQDPMWTVICCAQLLDTTVGLRA